MYQNELPECNLQRLEIPGYLDGRVMFDILATDFDLTEIKQVAYKRKFQEMIHSLKTKHIRFGEL
jgi:hypothetical protein